MSCIVKTEFSLGLAKLRIISQNLITDAMFRISSLIAHLFLIEYEQKDELKTLVLPERIFILFLHANLVGFKYEQGMRERFHL